MIFAQAPTMPWAQFGLAGLVIGALFAVLTYFIKSHREERKDEAALHRDERKEWRDVANAEQERARVREEGLQKVLMSLESTIRETGKRE